MSSEISQFCGEDRCLLHGHLHFSLLPLVECSGLWGQCFQCIGDGVISLWIQGSTLVLYCFLVQNSTVSEKPEHTTGQLGPVLPVLHMFSGEALVKDLSKLRLLTGLWLQFLPVVWGLFAVSMGNYLQVCQVGLLRSTTASSRSLVHSSSELIFLWFPVCDQPEKTVLKGLWY